MTMDEIKAMKDDFITPATAAKVMKMDTGRLIEYARNGELPFRVVISGNRVKIPRKAFLAAYCPEEQEKEKPTVEQQLLKDIAYELHMMNLLIFKLFRHPDPNDTGGETAQ